MDESNNLDALLEIVQFYLSGAHRSQIDQGGLVAALTSEITQQNPATRRAFTEGLRPLLGLLTQSVSERSAAAARKKAIVTLSAMLGALVLARAVDDDLLSDEFVSATTETLTTTSSSKTPRKRVSRSRVKPA